MDNLTKLCLVKSLDTDDIEVGKYKVDEIVKLHVTGIVQRREDTTSKVSVPWKNVLANVLVTFNIPRQEGLQKFAECVRLAYQQQDQDPIEYHPSVRQRLEDIEVVGKKIQSQVEEKPKKGATVVNAVIEELVEID